MLSKDFLSKNVYKELKELYGVSEEHIKSIINSWADEHSMDWHYDFILGFMPDLKNRKILDMAAGAGTFVINGLMKGYDVWGIEPEKWKIKYFNKRLIELGMYQYKDRVIMGVGEKLPFPDESFDFISSCQTLEHVNDVKKCLEEMLRVLKPNGIIWISCPDYGKSFFEPHYRIPMIPKLKSINRLYLRLIRRPLKGLDTINFISKNEILKYLREYTNSELEIIDLSSLTIKETSEKINKKLKIPKFIANIISYVYYNRKAFLLKSEIQTSLLIKKQRRINYEKNETIAISQQ